MKKYKAIIKKKKNHDKMVLLISKALIESNLSHDEFVLISNLLKECYDMKEETKNSNAKWKFKLYIRQCNLIVWSVQKRRK